MMKFKNEDHKLDRLTLFYKFIKKQSDRKRETPESLKVNDKTISNPEEIKDAWCNHFEYPDKLSYNRNFHDEFKAKNEKLKKILENLNNTDNTFFYITELEILVAIDKLKKGKTTDEGGLYAEYFHLLKHQISVTLTNLFNAILRSGRIPNCFQMGVVTPVFKKGKDPLLTTNYSGITVSSILGKLFELFDLIHKFGFTKNLSPNYASLLVIEAIAEQKDGNKPFYVTTLDAQKACDIVNKNTLLHKII